MRVDRFGSNGGLTNRPTNDYWHQNRSGIAGTAEAYDSFGATLAAGDFNDDGRMDVYTIQDPQDTINLNISAVDALAVSGLMIVR